MDHSDEQRNMGFKERHHFCFQTFYSNIRMPVHPEMVNSEGLLCAFRKLYLTKILNIPTSYPKIVIQYLDMTPEILTFT